MQNEILEFIQRRFPDDSHWLDGNCFYFAIILLARFSGELFYLPVSGHFCAKIAGDFYDWTGQITPGETPWEFDKIKNTDPLWYEHIIRDCVN